MHATLVFLALLLALAVHTAVATCNDDECSALLQVHSHPDETSSKSVNNSSSSKEDDRIGFNNKHDSAAAKSIESDMQVIAGAASQAAANIWEAAANAALSAVAGMAKDQQKQAEMIKNVSNAIANKTQITFDAGIKLQLECSGDNFIDCWELYTDTDPTEGFVKYVSDAEAIGLGIYKVNTSKGKGIYLGAATGTGGVAKSIRLQSKQRFTTGLFLIDIEHMPTGLGTWAAWWSCGPDWPNNGEIDTIETVSGSNTYTTLHTKAGCKQYVQDVSSNGNCNAGDGGTGCGITGGSNGPGTVPPNAAGQAFNDQGGGVYATWWTNNSIKVYMFPRSHIPQNIIDEQPNPLTWGSPYVSFPIGWGTDCEYEFFSNHQLVINLDFCGTWGGAVFPGTGKYSAGSIGCNKYIADIDLSDTAYWLINSVRVYKAD